MSKQEPVIGLHPLNDCVLVELKQSRKNVNTKEGKYDTRTEGIVVAVPEATPLQGSSIAIKFQTTNEFPEPKKGLGVIALSFLVGKIVHFEEFKEGSRIKRDGKMYSFIKIDDIRGYE